MNARAPASSTKSSTRRYSRTAGRRGPGGCAITATEPHEHAPFIDYENIPARTEGILVTHFITVRSFARSRAFYSEVLGGRMVLEENPRIVKLANSWILMNPGGRPTPHKPDISVVNYEPGNTVSTFMNLRVADIQGCYEDDEACERRLLPSLRPKRIWATLSSEADQPSAWPGHRAAVARIAKRLRDPPGEHHI